MAIELKDIQSTEWGLDIDNLGNVKQGLDDIKQCIDIILTTQKGTDPLRPDFGCGVYDDLDKPINSVLPNMIKSIKESIAKYETRVEKVSIKYSIVDFNLIFDINYKIKNTILTDLLSISYGLANT